MSEQPNELGAGDGSAPPARAHPLLTELVNSSLDLGYAQTAARRAAAGSARSAKRRGADTAAIVIGCLLAGFLVAIGYVHAHRTAPESQRVHDDLVNRVRQAQAAADGLNARVGALGGELAAARARALPANGPLAQRLAGDELGAGQLPVHGPGLVVTLREPPTPSTAAPSGRAGTEPIQQTNILTDRDISSVVDELWHDGAEAVAVNGIRLTPTSAIRFAGQAVLVDFQPITSPYTIEAVGSADALDVRFAQSAVASRYTTLAGVDGIGFTFATAADLSLPAGSPAVLRYARAGDGP